MRSSARWALSSDLCCLRLDPGDMLRRMTGPLPGFLEVCFIRAMEEAAVESESRGSAEARKTKKAMRRFGEICGSKERNGYSALTRGL